MSRRRRKRSKAPEPEILMERPPALRPRWETSRVLDLLDRIGAEKSSKEDPTSR